MMRATILSGCCLAALAATPVAACQIGGDDVFSNVKPTPPNRAAFSSVAFVHIEGEEPGASYRGQAKSPRGLLVGTAHVLQTIRGPKLPLVLPAYLAAPSSCSNFTRGGKRRFAGKAYLVGRLKSDANGTFLSLAEQSDTTGAWRSYGERLAR